tara:strand:- start:62 stop:409 length:348 start_codon:yes stop_codon:yes gene_type:complete
MEYYIFYMNFEDKVMPIYCTGIEVDSIMDQHCLFTGVKHLDDKAFPMLKVNAISLPKADIKYYLRGIESEPIELLRESEKEEEGDPVSEDDGELEIEEEIEPPSLKSRRMLKFKR